jgi:uncharacterized membrane protein
MNPQIVGLRVAGAIFGIVSAFHLLRLVVKFEITVAGWPMPLWVNAVGAVVTGGLCAWLWRLAENPPKS